MKLSPSLWIAFACACNALVGCYRFEEPNAADTNTNWLACKNDSDCGASTVCRAGRCAAPEPERVTDASVTSDADADGSAASIATGTSDAQVIDPRVAPTRGSRSVMLADVTAADGSFLISDAPLEAGPPAVRWLGNHFVVAYGAVDLAESSLRRLEVANVYEARIDTVWREHDTMLGGLEIAADGAIAAVTGADNDTECVGNFYTPSLDERSTLVVPCFEFMAGVGAAASGSDWPIVVASRNDVKVGRYDPWAETWLRPLQVVDSRRHANVVATIDDGNDAIVVWGGERTSPTDTVPLQSATYAARVSKGALASDAPSDVGATVSIEGAVHPDGTYSLAAVAGHVLILGFDTASLWSATLEGDGENPAVNMLPFPGIVGGAVTVPVEEHGLVGVCFGTNPSPLGTVGGLSFVVIDGEGVPMTEPTVITTEGVVAGFDVAWSGTEFLVAWWLIQGDPRTVSEVRGLRIPGPS